jgi:hypothetical protein
MKPIYVALSPDTYFELSQFLATQGAADDPTDVIELAVSYWIENAAWKQDALIPSRQEAQRGYRWKTLFMPSGTKLRMRYKGQYHYAEVVGDELHADGKPTSPAEFTHKVTNTSRNAWRDIEILRPTDKVWRLADTLRGAS